MGRATHSSVSSQATEISCTPKLGLSAQFVCGGFGRRFASLRFTDVNRTFVRMGPAAPYHHLYIVCLKGAISFTVASVLVLWTTSLLCALSLAAFACGYPGTFGGHWIQQLGLNLLYWNLQSDSHLRPFPGCSISACPVRSLILNIRTDTCILGRLPQVLGVEFTAVRRRVSGLVCKIV